MTETADFGGYSLVILPGETKVLFVVFSGIGQPNMADPSARGGLKQEFLNSTSLISPKPNRIFVLDWKRSWLNERRGRDEMFDFIRRYIRQHGVNRVVVVGTSMGGFAALIATSQFQVDTAIVFGAQTKLDHNFENRWKSLISRYQDGPFQDVLGVASENTRIFAIAGTQPWRDIWQHDRLLQRPNTRLLLYPWGEHNVAVNIRKAGKLETIFTSAQQSNDQLDTFFDKEQWDRENNLVWCLWSEGWQQLTLKNVSNAIDSFTACIKASPRFVPGWVSLARSNLEYGDLPATTVAVTEALRLNPKLAESHHIRSLVSLHEVRAAQAELPEGDARGYLTSALDEVISLFHDRLSK